MRLGLLFPGQGTQHPDMLRWLDTHPAAASTLASMAVFLGADWRQRIADVTWSQRNNVAQTLMTGLGIATWQCLLPRLPAPVAVAGYSVGELPAFCAAGVFDAATALALAAERAAMMDRSVAGRDTGLLAVHGVDMQSLTARCARHGLSIAIRLAAHRAVLGGAAHALARIEPELLALGARCTLLPVRIASHTPWVSSAAAAFEARLAQVPFAAARATLVCNRSGTVERDPADLKRVLAQQIDSPVLWDSCMDTMAERRVSCVLELGPGRALAKLWGERHPDIPVRSADEFRSPEAVVQWVTAILR